MHHRRGMSLGFKRSRRMFSPPVDSRYPGHLIHQVVKAIAVYNFAYPKQCQIKLAVYPSESVRGILTCVPSEMLADTEPST